MSQPTTSASDNSAGPFRHAIGRVPLSGWLALGFAAVFLVAGSFLGVALSERWNGIVAHYEARAAQLALASLRHTEQALLHADLALRSLDTDSSTDALTLENDLEDLHHQLRRLLVSSPTLEGIGVVGPQGTIRANGEARRPPDVDLSDRDYFQVHRENRDASLLISTPVQSRPSNTWVIPVSRRIETQYGTFAGMVAARIRPTYFEDFFQSLGVDVGVLLRTDGTVLTRFPVGAAGQRVGPDTAIMQQIRKEPAGHYHTVSPIDGGQRIAGYAVSSRFPIATAVAFDMAKILADWHAERNRIVLAAIGVAGLMLGVGAFAVRRARREASLIAQLAVAKAEAENASEMALLARDEAEAASQAKSTFLSRMSHELRTPLNAVIGFAQMLDLNREGTLTRNQKEFARHIASGGHHLLNLVNEVLDLAGIEAGKLKLSIERISVAEALKPVRDTMEPLAQQAGVTLAVSMPAVADIRADEQRLRQVLINLVANAIKYNQKGGSVTLTAVAAPGGRVRLVVADTGIGIAPERQNEIFVPFNRLGAEYSGIEGTGIGLALTKHLVEAMGGTIGFTSAPGLGSTFWAEFDSASSAEPDTDASAETLAQAPRAAGGGYSVLYVEDNPTNLRLVQHILTGLPKVTMLGAPTPQLGIDLAQAHRPDIIVLDLNLPGMDGFEVLARLKAMPETAAIPVMALSAAALPADLRKGVAAGFFRYLTKPIDVNAFLTAIDEALRAADTQRARAVIGH